MAIKAIDLENKVSVWGLVPESVKARMMNFKTILVDELETEVTFKSATGILLYRLHVEEVM